VIVSRRRGGNSDGTQGDQDGGYGRHVLATQAADNGRAALRAQSVHLSTPFDEEFVLSSSLGEMRNDLHAKPPPDEWVFVERANAAVRLTSTFRHGHP
jgi:hypothetical protein